MEHLLQNLQENIYFYLLGYALFGATLLEHAANPKKKMKNIAWYIQDFLYASAAIAVSVYFLPKYEGKDMVQIGIVVVAGITGSAIMRKVYSYKDKIADMLQNRFFAATNNNPKK